MTEMVWCGLGDTCPYAKTMGVCRFDRILLSTQGLDYFNANRLCNNNMAEIIFSLTDENRHKIMQEPGEW